MNKHLLFKALALVFPAFLHAQEPHPCGTAPVIDPWLLEYKQHPEQFASARSFDTLYAGVQVHLVARNNGTGRFTVERLLDAFCRLNLDFQPAAVQFFLKNDWTTPNNTNWYNHSDIPEGIEMMFENNVPDALNAYFVGDPAGNCGYNLPYAGVAIAHQCANPDDHTWTHEVGHALTLPHPFIGWEGKVYNFAVPTPDTLTYDYTHFHATPDTIVPAPLDTALVERLDGSNCGIAADLFCDTKPDYLSYRWNCDNNGQSQVTLKDQSGATFKADGTLYMSYSNDACSNRFSDDQIATLRANLLTQKTAWLHPGAPYPDISGSPVLLSPNGGETVPAVDIPLHWSPAPGATHYLVQVSRFSNYVVKNYDLVVTDTTFTAATLLPNYTYYWRVRPFNYGHTCASFTENASFYAIPSSSVGGLSTDDNFRYYPTRLSPDQQLTLEIPASWLNQTAECRFFDATGRLVWQTRLTPGTEKITLSLPSDEWEAGIYRMVWTNSTVSRSATLFCTGGQ